MLPSASKACLPVPPPHPCTPAPLHLLAKHMHSSAPPKPAPRNVLHTPKHLPGIQQAQTPQITTPATSSDSSTATACGYQRISSLSWSRLPLRADNLYLSALPPRPPGNQGSPWRKGNRLLETPAKEALPTRVAGQRFTKPRPGHTKPFSSAPRLKIWAPRGDRALAAPLRGPGDGPAGWGDQAPGAPGRRRAQPGRGGAARRPGHLKAPGKRRQVGRDKGSEDSPSSGVGLRRPPESAARPPGHMARRRAEDQRGFVAEEQGASRSAGRGRRDGDRHGPQREALGGRSSGGGRAAREGAPRQPPPPRCLRDTKEFPRQQEAPPKESGMASGRGRERGRGSPGSPARPPSPPHPRLPSRRLQRRVMPRI